MSAGKERGLRLIGDVGVGGAELQTASTSPLGATLMFPVPTPKGRSVLSVTGVLHELPAFTEACRPPEGGMKSTAEVEPLVETAMPPPFATNCGVLQVCAKAGMIASMAIKLKIKVHLLRFNTDSS